MLGASDFLQELLLIRKVRDSVDNGLHQTLAFQHKPLCSAISQNDMMLHLCDVFCLLPIAQIDHFLIVTSIVDLYIYLPFKPTHSLSDGVMDPCG